MDYSYIFVLVIYKHYGDLENYLKMLSSKFDSYRVIIVNNYYDDETKEKVFNIACSYDCDFINANNDGYGAGNNRGIELAKSKYKFKYLIVSNTDIEILSFDHQILEYDDCAIYAPRIKTINNKNQNPYWVYDFNLGQKLIYKGFRDDNKFKLYLGYALNKILRLGFIFTTALFFKRKRKCFGSHGAFVIYTYKALDVLGYPYDENMFLFSEEAHVAHLAKEKKIKTYYIPKTRIKHFEDASMGNVNLLKEEAKSYQYFYTHHHKLRGMKK